MKILEKKEWTRECSCRICKTRVEINAEDVRYATSHDYGGGCDISFDWICPSCGTDNDLKSLPLTVEDQARKAWNDNGKRMVNMKKRYQEMGIV